VTKKDTLYFLLYKNLHLRRVEDRKIKRAHHVLR
jgi:hypothetical protein